MKLPKYVVSLISTLIFTLLFFEQDLGLNVPIFALITVLLMLVFDLPFFRSNLNKVVVVGFMVSSVNFFLHGTSIALFMTFTSFILLYGLHASPSLRSLLYAIPNALHNYGAAWYGFRSSFSVRSNGKARKRVRLGAIIKTVFLPFFVILVFMTLYSIGSEAFRSSITQILETLGDLWRKYVDIAAIGVLLAGLLISVIHSLRMNESSWSKRDTMMSDILKRIRLKHRFGLMDLKVEFRSAILLLSTLSVLLSILLFTEIRDQWINYSWNGEFLKYSVHEGTYVLIFSILLSIAVVMYYFRRNLNFYPKNMVVRSLGILWIGLNVILVIAVAIRNVHYIEYFGLAYRRIGVFIFLLLALVGLVTMVVKLYRIRSLYFVMRVNVLAAYLTLVITAAFNWDVIIAKYNIEHSDRSFVHLPFLLSLDDSTLPYLQLTDEQVAHIEQRQVEKIPFAKRGYFKDEAYQDVILDRSTEFMNEHENKSWLEVIWDDRKAYEQLNSYYFKSEELE